MTESKLICGNALAALKTLPDESVHCVVTSPPYWGLRSYLAADHPEKPFELGGEKTPDEFVAKLVIIFREVRRVLRKDGTLWLNIGDTYSTHAHGHSDTHDPKYKGGRNRTEGPAANRVPIPGLKNKDLVGIPWMVAFALRGDGWYLRAENIWQKPNVIPFSGGDRTTREHEHVFHLSKSKHYFYDAAAIAEPVSQNERNRRLREHANNHEPHYKIRRNEESVGPGAPYGKTSAISSVKARLRAYLKGTRNCRSVWTISTTGFRPPDGCKKYHFATFPIALPTLCIKAGCPPGGTVLDPFAGAGTTGLMAAALQRNFIGVDISRPDCEMAAARIHQAMPLFCSPEVTVL